jgi:two-component system copper resistance phosphate regulon response regulator CusR
MRILVVEDEKKVREFITRALEQAGMVVDTVENTADLFATLDAVEYDALVLDRLLGGHDSLESIREIRGHHPHVKILVLSALSEVDDKVRGLTEGADDYLGKPFHVAELVARLRTLLRRVSDEERPARDTSLSYEDLSIDLEKQRVTRGDRRIDLTGKEFRLLCLFARHPGQIFSKAALLDQVWDLNHYPESNIVEVTIANLRAKLDKGLTPLIRSRRGVGYWLGEA